MRFAEIGYFGRGAAKATPSPLDSSDAPENETVFRTDSERAISFRNDVRSIVIFGGTGSGKPIGCVLPIFEK